MRGFRAGSQVGTAKIPVYHQLCLILEKENSYLEDIMKPKAIGGKFKASFCSMKAETDFSNPHLPC